MKITIPENLSGKALFKFLIENKSALIAQKKSIMKRAEAVFADAVIMNAIKAANGTKADGQVEEPVDTGVMRVKVVCNTALWCDYGMDVLTPSNAARSIRERKGLIPHIHDHIWEVTAEIGDVASIYYQDIALSELGIDKPGTAQCLVMETDIKKAYNEKVYNKYRAGKIKQHSIGFQYVTIELAINDEDSQKEHDFWKKYYDQLINPEAVDDKGYFWVVSEIKLLENSAVLFGMNILTPTLESDDKSESSTEVQPPIGTGIQPQKSEQAAPSIDWGKISTHLFTN